MTPQGSFTHFYPTGAGVGCGLLSDGGGRCEPDWPHEGSARDLPDVMAMSVSQFYLALIDLAGALTVDMDFVEPVDTVVVSGSWTAIAGDDWGSFCGLQRQGTLVCWDLGPGPTSMPVPLSAPTGTYQQVCLTANDQACVLDAGGKATCWGAERMEAPDETFSKLACGTHSVCGLTDDGRIVCWGACDNGECDVPTYE